MPTETGKPRKNSSGCPTGEATMPQPHGGAIGNPPHVPTDITRRFVVEHAAMRGQVWTAIQIGIDRKTLWRHYTPEIQQSKANACAAIGASLFQKALAGDGASQRFFLITQGGGDWSPKVKHEHSGPGGGPMQSVDLTRFLEGMSDEQLAQYQQFLEALAAAGGLDIPGGNSGIAAPSEGGEGEA